jgi:hypothetical protein
MKKKAIIEQKAKLYNAGNICLSDGKVHQRVIEKSRARTERELAASNKCKEEQDKKLKKS